MLDQPESVKTRVIGEIKRHIQEKLPIDQADVLMQLADCFYGNVSDADISARTPIDLYGALLMQWQLLSPRKRGEVRLQVYNPHYEKHGWQSTHTIVALAMDDKPFLVDSLRMKLNAHELNVHLTIHLGAMIVERNKSDKVTNIQPFSPDAPEGPREALIYMEFDRQTDPAILEQLQMEILEVINDVELSVEDWPAMRERLAGAVKELDHLGNKFDEDEISEVKDFLDYLDAHFTMLASCYYKLVKEGKQEFLVAEEGSVLGLLRGKAHINAPRPIASLTSEAREQLFSNQILIISKVSSRSPIHRPAFMDYIGIKRFDKSGEVIGELRLIGLHTSSFYTSSPRYIPMLRRKVEQVVKMAPSAERGHAGKALLHVLETLPRDDLFQTSIPELFELAQGILHLQERRCVRLFARKDIYGRFVSCLVYVPRERFNTELRRLMQAVLEKRLNATEVNFATWFSDSVLARIHFIVHTDTQTPIEFDVDAVEEELIRVTRSWTDDVIDALNEHHGEEKANVLVQRYARAFRASYRDDFPPRTAVYDIEHLESALENNTLDMSFYRPIDGIGNSISFKLFHPEQTVPLSDALPVLENLGLRVIGERPYQINLDDGQVIWINDFNMQYCGAGTLDIDEVRETFQDAFRQIWQGNAENDGFNRLVLAARLTWRETMLLRAYSRYLKQIGSTFSQSYVEETLYKYAPISRLLVDLFKARFDPELMSEESEIEFIEAELSHALEKVTSLDEDRIINQLFNLMMATTRTNFYQLDEEGTPKNYLSIKLEPENIKTIPLPRPKYEIFVYSPRFEGVHLRSSKVARGGLRWSDRREDFRTEVLGLMKAQVVKNAVIVPSGAKGGFVPKCLPENGTRDQIQAEGIACYQNFIRGLLDITDNFKEKQVIKPKNVRCYDEDDPYLVVAADKGTATFSDIANAISVDYGFWMGDAFASGGETGYDHKKMGITARGAWVSVQRHFRELGHDVQSTDFTVVGIGDMGGDVFGNGMLLSRHIKLVAAFNHMHIFIDPNPNPEKSFLERERLFKLPRSSWEDYDANLISKGGGIYSRSAKSIKLSEEARELLAIKEETIEPTKLMAAILKAPVDLLWNGGIGTYVKAAEETAADVGDRANDMLRVNGKDLRCKVVGEGGNLGLTQLGRIEYALNGGAVNTDFIDNSAGVDCSDHEVNIKILLAQIVANGDMTEKQRNELLAEMTDDVASLVLRHNYLQTLALTISQYRALGYTQIHWRYMREQERLGLLNRELEFLPSKDALFERKAIRNQGLSRPELSVLLAYSKSIIKAAILDSDIPDDPAFSDIALRAFPERLRKKYSTEIKSHPLCREIIATQLSDNLVNEVGLLFVHRLQDETGAPISTIVRAYNVVSGVFDLPRIWGDIQALDYQVPSKTQTKMIIETMRLTRRVTRWFLRNRRQCLNLEGNIQTFGSRLQTLLDELSGVTPSSDNKKQNLTATAYVKKDVPEDLANRVASTRMLFSAPDLMQVSISYDADLITVASIYFLVGERLELGWLRDQVTTHIVESRWDALMRESLRDDLDWQQRALSVAVLQHAQNGGTPKQRVDRWLKDQGDLLVRWQTILGELRSTESPDFTMYNVVVRELLGFAQASNEAASTQKSTGPVLSDSCESTAPKKKAAPKKKKPAKPKKKD